MNEKYKGKLCVYCGERPSSKTGDHVFARGFFLESERTNPIKVPACIECNNEKSRIEYYLASVLPFGGRHKDAKEILSTRVPNRLDKNNKLRQILYSGMSSGLHLDENGMPLKCLTIPFDGACYTELFRYIAKALAWYHWRIYISKHYCPVKSRIKSTVYDRHLNLMSIATRSIAPESAFFRTN